MLDFILDNLPPKIRTLFGLDQLGSTSYLKEGRLEDVHALIQFLALNKYAQRSDEALDNAMQGAPISANSWREIAEQHRELFRVRDGGVNRVSLISRFSTTPLPNDEREPLPHDFTEALLTTATNLHDRQLKRSERWVQLIPLWTAVLAALASLIVALISAGAAIVAVLMKDS